MYIELIVLHVFPCDNTISFSMQFKSEFKLSLTSLEATRAEVPLCLEYVMQSRRRLLKEFESWFKNAFIGETSKPKTPSNTKVGQ